MGDLYASAIGTTMLQLKEIPRRPPKFDGALCLFGIRDGVDEFAIRAAFSSIGHEVDDCDCAGDRATVRFATRLVALEAKAHGPPAAICTAIDFQYNERGYDERGWCTFEEAVSDELIVRLNLNMRAALEALPPKKIVLGQSSACDDAKWADTRVVTVVKRIVKATFTGAGDKLKVIALYKKYAERISQATLPLMTILPQASRHALPMATRAAEPQTKLPSVSLEPLEPLRLASGQLVLLRDGEGGGTQFGVVDANGRKVACTLSDGESAELSDGVCVQEVLPWKPPEDGWAEALRCDVEALPERIHKLAEALPEVGQPPTKAGLQHLYKLTRSLFDAASKLPSVAQCALEAGATVQEPLNAVSSLLNEGVLNQAQINELNTQMGRVRAAITKLEPEALAAAALRATGGVGWRRYAVGQPLFVRTHGAWYEAEVVGEQGSRHRLRLEGGEEVAELALHPWNHAPRELSHSAFAQVRAWHAASMHEQHSHITDALSGQKLDALQQCVAIDVVGGGDASVVVSDARSLAAWLKAQHEERLKGDACEQAPAALLTAGPAAGKTTLLSQVMALSLEGELVPILIKVQRLQGRLHDAPDAFASAWNWVDAFLRLELAEAPTHYRFLRQAMLARRTLLLLDGLDEGGQRREAIEAHVAQVLAPQGHVMLCTSRPAGVTEQLFAGFRRLQLAPLTEAQQQEALTQRLGSERAAKLMPYVRDKVLRDAGTGERVTSNPLMLSMVASVFEVRGDLQMPKTVAELYEMASDAMLARGGASSDVLRRLLQHIFFEAHVAQRRVIEDRQLDEAALGMDRPEALARIRAVSKPLFGFQGRAKKGHYVEVLTAGHAGKRGTISEVEDDGMSNPYKVTFADGRESNWLEPDQLKSSGLDQAAFMVRFDELDLEGLSQVRAACSELPETTRKALAEVRRRVARDSLPLLSLLQVEPLQLQSSHLSFQEYFAARALCEKGMVLSGPPPWQWPVWWANALAIGGEMGEPFAKGLVQAARIDTGEKLNLSKELGGDRLTAMRVVKVLCGQLKLTSLDLSENQLDAAAAKVLAEAVSVSASLTSVR